jgi:hypothetical protein
MFRDWALIIALEIQLQNLYYVENEAINQPLLSNQLTVFQTLLLFKYIVIIDDFLQYDKNSVVMYSLYFWTLETI